MDNNIKQFINSYSRNKLILTAEPIDNIDYIDIGKVFSKHIKEFLGNKMFSLKAKMELDEVLDSNIMHADDIGKYLAITNLGILLEPELKIDFVQILDKYSSSNTLFVKWEGEIEDGILYFLTKEKGQKIDIKKLSHIYEV
jgi:hypothetical protein